jgi:hypothetical protein
VHGSNGYLTLLLSDYALDNGNPSNLMGSGQGGLKSTHQSVVLFIDMHQPRYLSCRVTACFHVLIEVWALAGAGRTISGRAIICSPSAPFLLDQGSVKKNEMCMILDATPSVSAHVRSSRVEAVYTGPSRYEEAQRPLATKAGVDM